MNTNMKLNHLFESNSSIFPSEFNVNLFSQICELWSLSFIVNLIRFRCLSALSVVSSLDDEFSIRNKGLQFSYILLKLAYLLLNARKVSIFLNQNNLYHYGGLLFELLIFRYTNSIQIKFTFWCFSSK